MDARRRLRSTPATWLTVVLVTLLLGVTWVLAAGTWLIPPYPEVLNGLGTCLVFLVVLLRGSIQHAALEKRIGKLERLLDTDEAAIAALSEQARPPDLMHDITRPGPIVEGVRDAIAAYELAGYTRDEAKGLAREALLLQIRQAGGWSP